MVFIRGHALDYEGWRQSGCAGWSYGDVLPYFKQMESYNAGDDAFRGADDPLNVYRPIPEDPLALAFITSGKQASYPVTEDISGYRQERFGSLDRSVYAGERWGTARAYLETARNRPNLTLVIKAQVQRLVIDVCRVTGVVYKYG